MTNINTFQGDVFIHEYIKHTGDDNNLFGFSGTDTFKIATAGTDRLVVGSDGNVTITNAIIIPDYIYHTGDLNNLFGFSGTDTFKIATAGVDRLTVDSNGYAHFSKGIRLPEGDSSINIQIPNYIYHTGDDNNLFGFSGTDTFKIATAGTDRLTVAANGTVTIPGTINYGGTDLANSATITASADAGNNTIVRRSASGYVFANYFNSTANDVSAGVTKVMVETSNDGYIRHGTAAAIRTFIGATSADTADTVAMRDGSGDLFARLFRTDYTNQSTISGALAYRVSTSDNYIRFCSDAAAIRTFIGCLATSGTAATATKVQVSRDDTGDTANYLVFAPTATAGQHNLQMDSGLIYDNTNNRLRVAQVMFGDQNVYGLGAVQGQYGSVGTLGTGKSSYEGYSINGQWVFMSNGAGSCGIYNDTDNEWGTRWHQNAQTELYYNGGNKFQTTNDGAHCSGALYADHMYIDDYLYHSGDTDTRIGFGTNTIYMRTAGSDRLTINSSGKITMPAIPCFFVYRNGGYTVNSETNAIVFTAADANNGSHYSGSNGRFTAPVTGFYAFHAQGLHRKINGNGSVEPTFYQNNGNVSGRGMGFSHMVDTGEQTCRIHMVHQLNSSQYVTHGLHTINSVTDYYYGERLGNFSGYLLG
jgi:hypothetical protein